MSEALEKNRHALRAVGGGAVSSRLIQTARIGAWTGGARSRSAGLAAEALGELLGRFWHNIDAGGPSAGGLVGAAVRSSSACGVDSVVQSAWDPPYDFAIGLGEPIPPGCAAGSVTIGADGWTAFAGPGAPLGDDANPVGPLAAAALAAAEALKSVFGLGSRRGAARLPASHEWNAWYGAPLDGAPAPAASSGLDLGEVHVFGVGAVSHALLWIVRRWPGRVTGRVRLIDPDTYDAGNPQRYIGTAPGDEGRPKASGMAQKLRQACPHLEAIAYDTDMNDYFARHNPDCMIRTAVCGLDSKEGRRQLGLKLPRTIVNMWTSGFHAGASTFSFDDGWPCMHCAYPPPVPGGAMDEASAICAELGLAPRRTRELLDSARSIDESDAKAISAATGVRAADIGLKPVRSVRTEMCATGRIRARRAAGGGDADADAVQVPLAFASVTAGLAGFIELVRAALRTRRVPGQFQASVLKYPSHRSWTRCDPDPQCGLCTDPVRRRARDKYAAMPDGAEDAAQ